MIAPCSRIQIHSTSESLRKRFAAIAILASISPKAGIALDTNLYWFVKAQADNNIVSYSESGAYLLPISLTATDKSWSYSYVTIGDEAQTLLVNCSAYSRKGDGGNATSDASFSYASSEAWAEYPPVELHVPSASPTENYEVSLSVNSALFVHSEIRMGCSSAVLAELSVYVDGVYVGGSYLSKDVGMYINGLSIIRNSYSPPVKFLASNGRICRIRVKGRVITQSVTRFWADNGPTQTTSATLDFSRPFVVTARSVSDGVLLPAGAYTVCETNGTDWTQPPPEGKPPVDIRTTAVVTNSSEMVFSMLVTNASSQAVSGIRLMDWVSDEPPEWITLPVGWAGGWTAQNDAGFYWTGICTTMVETASISVGDSAEMSVRLPMPTGSPRINLGKCWGRSMEGASPTFFDSYTGPCSIYPTNSVRISAIRPLKQNGYVAVDAEGVTPGAKNTLEWSDSLAPDSWQEFDTFTIEGSEIKLNIPFDDTYKTRFFRIRSQ